MIKITKRKEPQEWTRYRLTPGATYQSIPELVDSLLKEQGYICAYCMRRIPCKDRLSTQEDGNFVLTAEDHRIEHIKSRNRYQAQKLDYSNMVICCPGHIGDEDHCDRHKGDMDIHFSPSDPDFILTLAYKSDGEITSSNDTYNQELNDVLNLNTPLLKKNRAESWQEVLRMMIEENGKRPWTRTFLSKYIEKYSSMHNKGGVMQYIPYCGIVLYNLQKKLRQL